MERVVVEEANPAWPQYFADIRDSLGAALRESVVRIEHVGSTAVPGLAAKPVIDLDVVVADRDDVGPVLTAIESLGYRWLGDLGLEGREAFAMPEASPFASHHLYLVVENNRAHTDHWLLRETLLAEPLTRDHYAEVKRHNAAISPDDRERYTALKAGFVADVLTRARRERGLDPVAYWRPDLS